MHHPQRHTAPRSEETENWYGYKWKGKIGVSSYEHVKARQTALGRARTSPEDLLILVLQQPVPLPKIDKNGKSEDDILERMTSPVGRHCSPLLCVFDPEYPGLWTVEDYSTDRHILYCRCAVPQDQEELEAAKNDEKVYKFPSIKYYPREWGKPIFMRMPKSGVGGGGLLGS